MADSTHAPVAPDQPDSLHYISELAVLTSGGLDSAILLAESVARKIVTHPLYVCAGHPWESQELAELRRLVANLDSPHCRAPVVLQMPVTDLYGNHWSLSGQSVPDENSADEAVFLPGRNVLLLAKGMLWCHLNGVPALAQGVLRGNPFPDATDCFYQDFEKVVNRAVGGSVRILRPYARLKKVEIMSRAGPIPQRWSFSCIRPVAGKHCGHCNKCAERRKAFRDAGLTDPTPYSAEDACTA